MDTISDRLWIPHQAALEYQENRLTVIAEQVAKFDGINKSLNTELSKLKKRHPSIKLDELIEPINGLFEKLIKDLESQKDKHPDLLNDDKLRDKLDILFKGKVGPAPTQENLDKIYKDGESRYKTKCPPGYQDEDKSDVKKIFPYDGLARQRKYGDLVLWHQIIDEANANSHQSIIFITDDRKSDWWWIVNSSGDKTIGPHPALVKEILSKTQISYFYIYNSERFLEQAKKYLEISVRLESVQEIGDALKASERHIAKVGDVFYGNQIVSWINEKQMREKATIIFRQWIVNSFPNDEILDGDGVSIDFIRIESPEGSKNAYKVVYIPSRQDVLTVIRSPYYQALSQRLDGTNALSKIKSFALVFAFDNNHSVEDYDPHDVGNLYKILFNLDPVISNSRLEFIAGSISVDRFGDGSFDFYNSHEF